MCSYAEGVIKAIERSGHYTSIPVNTTEYRFKLALHNKRFNEVQKILEQPLFRSKELCGNSIVNYLKDKGFPEIALHFIEDDKTRFELAIQAGMIEDGLSSAYSLNKADCWEKLGLEALK